MDTRMGLTGGFTRLDLVATIGVLEVPILSLSDFDFSRPLNKKERASAAARVMRLDEEGPLWASANHAGRTIEFVGGKPTRLLESGFRVRAPFVYQAVEPAGVDASDRRALPRKDRPPLTRILSSQGATLRLELAALAIGQMRYKSGTRRPPLNFPIWGHAGERSWADMIATEARPTRVGTQFYVEKDKRARSVGQSLKTLEKAGLVSLGRVGSRNVVTFLDEGGVTSAGGAVPYEVPLRTEPTVTLPGEFVLNGWMHVLDDSEIAVLFMAACGKGGFADENGYAIPGAVRLLNYGIGRESYSKALKTLSWFGLLDVHEVSRHDDGRSVDFAGDAPQLHRIRLIAEGLQSDGPTQVLATLRKQLGRVA